MGKFKQELKNIKAFVFDVDGVFTDGKILFTDEGRQMRNMNVKDGYAIHLAVKKNIPIGIITGGTCNSIVIRFNSLGVTDLYIASKNKMDNFLHFLNKYSLQPEDILYMGDDLPDYQVMKIVGLPTCPSDASQDIKNISHYISDKKGGEGCVRDVVEQTLRAKGMWMDTDAFVW
ncbi:MAG: HAD-IIIA family hydrolase [Bacteroidales bacterium]|nr:HAD-IIIA family hydrolase [Bacteroidales bacterium]